MTAQNNLDQGHQTVIDNKFPLTWLIGCSAAIVFTIGSYAFQANSMSKSLDNLTSKMEKRDESQNIMQQNALIQQGQINVMGSDVKRNSTDIIELKRDIEEIKRRQTWAPK